jgi:hypothetical protein
MAISKSKVAAFEFEMPPVRSNLTRYLSYYYSFTEMMNSKYHNLFIVHVYFIELI